MRRILVTSALPYINGDIHLGYLVEAIQTDIWVRYQKLRGHEVRYFCADDTHGTATMLRAKKEGRTEDELIAEVSTAHQEDLQGFGISIDHYSNTHCKANRALCEGIWKCLRDANLIVEKEVEQLYDAKEGIFLADRFVRGTCPNCKAPDQAGDNCASCNSTYTPADLIDPVSVLSGSTPESRMVPHLFVQLDKMHAFLQEWTQSGTLPPESANYLNNFFLNEKDSNGALQYKPLKDWDVSRPAPYFGFRIPDSPREDYWYVWFDAPIGYMASTKEWCDANGDDIDNWWRGDKAEIHHFIGKDIQYFHTLFWPAMLKTACYNLPTNVRIHGFLTVDGKKMSKREGTYIRAATYLKHLDPAALRYFYASRLSSKIEDIDLNLKEFETKVNTDLVGKVVNIASRTAKFLKDTGLSAEYPDDGGLFAEAAAQGDAIAEAYENTDYSRAMRMIVDIADKVNPFVETNAPWGTPQRPGERAKAPGRLHGGAQRISATRHLPRARPPSPRRADRGTLRRTDHLLGSGEGTRRRAPHQQVQTHDAAARPEKDSTGHRRGQRGGGSRGRGERQRGGRQSMERLRGRLRGRTPCRRDHHRGLRQSRPARGTNHRSQRGSRSAKARPTHPEPWRRSATQRVRRNQGGVSTE